MPGLLLLILFVVVIAIVAYFTGGTRPALGTLAAGLLLAIVFHFAGVF